MFWLNYAEHSLWLNVVILAVAAGVVWYAGTRAAGCSGGISDRTRIWRIGIDSPVVLAFGLLLFAVLYAAR